MQNIYKNRTFFLCCLVSIFITGCDAKKAVYDQYDPNFHGQVIHFKVPVVYILLHKENLGKYHEEAVKIGRALVSKELVADSLSPYSQYQTEEINEDMSFTITSSYWVRHNWFYREFVDDYRRLVLQDENKIISSCSITMLMYSDRGELLK
jgi:hypothetical protein